MKAALLISNLFWNADMQKFSIICSNQMSYIFVYYLDLWPYYSKGVDLPNILFKQLLNLP